MVSLRSHSDQCIQIDAESEVDNDNNKHTTFTLNKNTNNECDKERKIIPKRNEAAARRELAAEDVLEMDEVIWLRHQHDTKSISKNPYKSSVAPDKNTNETHQNTHWLIMATIILTASVFTAQKIRKLACRK